MKHLFFILLSGILLSSCAKSFADFTVQQNELTVPATASFTATAEDADQILWDIDGNVYTDLEASHRFITSGKHDVTLTVNKGKKVKTMTKEIVFNAPEKCLIEISTPQGNMLVELYEETPKHRDNFVKLAGESYYNGTLFHRVIKGFMIQGGDPSSKNASADAQLGSGGPGYQIDAEFDERFAHVKGALAAARLGGPANPDKKSSGSQFYIVDGKDVTAEQLENSEASKGLTYTEDTKQAYLENGGTPFLDGDYTVFGRVIEGLDVIDKIVALSTGQGDRPRQDVQMSVNVIK